MSKFDYESFIGGYDDLAVSKEKHSKEEAIDIAKIEFAHRKCKYLFVGSGYTRHRAGINEDNEPCVGWWLEYSEHKGSCPCYVFHTGNNESINFNNRYEVIAVN